MHPNKKRLRRSMMFLNCQKPGLIKEKCAPNALSTFEEYLLDYGTPEAREAGERAIAAALDKAEATGAPAGAMVLPDGRIITGKTSGTLGAAAALLLNALKALGNIDDQFELISKQVLEPVCHLKTTYLDHRNPRLHTDEVLLTLAISALTNPLADLAKRQLPGLRDSEAHFSVIISEEDLKIFKRLGVRVSCEPKYETKRLYHR